MAAGFHSLVASIADCSPYRRHSPAQQNPARLLPQWPRFVFRPAVPCSSSPLPAQTSGQQPVGVHQRRLRDLIGHGFQQLDRSPATLQMAPALPDLRRRRYRMAHASSGSNASTAGPTNHGAAIVHPGKRSSPSLSSSATVAKGGKYRKQDCEMNVGMLQRLRDDYPRGGNYRCRQSRRSSSSCVRHKPGDHQSLYQRPGRFHTEHPANAASTAPSCR